MRAHARSGMHTARLRLALPGVVCALLLAACQPMPVKPSPAGQAAPDTTPPPAPAPERTAPAPKQKKPRKPKPAPSVVTAAQPSPPADGEQLFARLVARLADAPCVQDRVVQRWERLYAGYPPKLAANLENILPLMAMVVEEIETHHLPGEFALLPIVESWYRPDAQHAGAAGMWQFTAATARLNGLRIVPGFDERLAPQAATRAAMRYLGLLHSRFGDWKLADMAYNAGDYRLQRVLARQPGAQASATAHAPQGLSMTTYEHLAKIQALACIIAKPERFGLRLPTGPLEALRLAQAPRAAASLDAVAELAGLPVAQVRRLNPAFAKGVIARNAPRDVLLPASAHARLMSPQVAALPAVPVPEPPADTSAATAREYVIRRGDTLGAIARRLGVSLENLLRWNGLDVRAILRPGQVLRLEH